MENNLKQQEMMTSLQIAEVTGKAHKDVMRAIRKMEDAWEKINGRNFTLVEYLDQKGEKRPCYQLTKTECLYIATKFNDEARAKLVLRWQELEMEAKAREKEEEPLTQAELLLKQAQMFVDMERKQKEIEKRTASVENEIADMKREREEATYNLYYESHLAKELPPQLTKEQELNLNIRRMVNEYATAMNIHQQDIYRDLYKDLYYKYHIAIRSYQKKEKESNLDVAARIGCLDKIHILISDKVRNLQRSSIIPSTL